MICSCILEVTLGSISVSAVTTSCFSSEEFWENPQYRLTVKAVDGENKGDKNVLLSLLQKPDEEYRSKVTYHAMGFIIYKVSGVFMFARPFMICE